MANENVILTEEEIKELPYTVTYDSGFEIWKGKSSMVRENEFMQVYPAYNFDNNDWQYKERKAIRVNIKFIYKIE